MNYYFAYKADGTIAKKYMADSWSNTVLASPDEIGMLGPLDATDATAQDAFAHPSHYTIQQTGTTPESTVTNEDGTETTIPATPIMGLVKTVTDAQLLAEAQAAQIATITAAFNATLVGGFASKSTGHTYPSDAAAERNFTGGITAFTTNPSKTAITLQTLDAGWVSHTKDQFYAMYNDGDAWKEAQYPQLATLEGEVRAATTVAAVQAAVWTPATY